MSILLVVIYVLVCIFLVLVVLLQQGKGADLAGAFGGGGSQTSFGPRSASNIMHRMTTGSFVLFVVLSLALAILSGKQRSSVMEAVEAPAPAAIETTQEAGEEAVAPVVVEETEPAADTAAAGDTAADDENPSENE
ncbi:MAG: preprotein translocase subunit SecG [Thermoanaerobaculales bacterium]|jgi:preprotein translocase subunit SecG|nr:preprotein translocase subunit SecG [Thermoanaerobaculales bacterium]